MTNDSLRAEEALKDLLAPVHALDARLLERETELRKELDEVKKERTKLRGVLRAIEPGQAPKRRRGSATDNGHAVSDQRVDEILRFIQAHRDNYKDGFVAGPLARDINLSGDPVGKDTVRKAVLVLHDRGIVRAVRKTVGGGTLYQLVGQ